MKEFIMANWLKLMIKISSELIWCSMWVGKISFSFDGIQLEMSSLLVELQNKIKQRVLPDWEKGLNPN